MIICSFCIDISHYCLIQNYNVTIYISTEFDTQESAVVITLDFTDKTYGKALMC